MEVSVKFAVVELYCDGVVCVLIDGPYEPGEIETCYTLLPQIPHKRPSYLHRYRLFPLHGVLPGWND